MGRGLPFSNWAKRFSHRTTKPRRAMLRPSGPHHRRLVCEALEDRRLLSVGGYPELPGMVLVDPRPDQFQGQIVYLDFDGAEAVTYNGPVKIEGIDVRVFEAPPELAGQEQEIIADVVTQLEETFAGTGITFTTVKPDAEHLYTTVFVGGDDSDFREFGAFLGLAEHVDAGNQSAEDNAIVFADRFSSRRTTDDTFPHSLSEGIAHELGHLLGYEHEQGGASPGLLSSVAAFADFYSDYDGSNWGAEYVNYETITSSGTYTFEVNGIAANRVTEWYVNGDYQEGQDDESGSGWDPQYDVYCGSGTTHVNAVVYYDSGTTWYYVETHTWHVTLDTTGPNPPSLLAPSNGAVTTDSTVSLDWSNASDPSGIAYYQVQVDNSSSFSSPEFDATPTSSSDTTSSLNDSLYYWHVRARDNAGNWGGWSSSRTFRVDTTAPSTPPLVSPADNGWTEDQTPTFDWSNSTDSGSGLDHYEIEIYDGDLTWGDISDTTTVSTYTPSENIPYDTIYWKVRAVDNAGIKSSWSDEWTLHILDITPPSVPSLLSPSNGAVTTDPTVSLDWSDATDMGGIDYYQVQVDDNSNFASPEFDATPSSSSDTTSSLSDDLYYWHARARDNAGNWGAWSPSRTFRVDTTAPSTPTLVSPADNGWTEVQTPTFDWSNSTDSGSGLDHYEIEIYDGDITWGDISDTATVSTYTPSENIPYDTIYWKVRAVDSAGNKSSWSDEWTLDIRDITPPGVPPLLLPPNGAIISDPTVYLDWSDVSHPSGIDCYQVQVDTSPSFSHPVLDETTSSSNATALLLSDRQYCWRVRARNNAGNWSTWSPTWTFLLDATAPSMPTLVSPADGSSTSDQTPTFDWSNSTDSGSGLDHYEIEIYDGDITWGDISDTATVSTYTPSENIPYDTIYWKVRAVDSAGIKSSWSDEWTLDIIANEVPTIHLTSPDSDLTVVRPAGVSICWTDSDPDDNATIVLFYDPDTNDAPWEGTNNHTAIATISEDDPADQYLWDTTDVPFDTYSIWAMISDGHGDSHIQYSRAPGLVTIEPPPPPFADLQPTSAGSSVWQSAVPGRSVDWSATVRNSGPGMQTADWTVSWYLSTDTAYDSSDLFVTSATYNDDIASGASRSKSETAVVPSGVTGQQYYVLAVVATSGPESSTVNNDYAGSPDWFGAVPSDSDEPNETFATATDLGTLSSTSTYARNNRTLDRVDDKDVYKFKIINTGQAGNVVRIDFANIEGDLSAKLYDSGQILLATSDGSGNSEELPLSGLSAGTYYFEVNSAQSDVSPDYDIAIVPPAPGYLHLTSVDSGVWQSAEPGRVVDWSATVENDGPGTYTADWTVMWYLSPDTTYSSSDILVMSVNSSVDVPSGSMRSVTETAPVPNGPTGDQYFVVARLVTAGLEFHAASSDTDWFGEVAPDSDEPNGTYSSATNLGTIADIYTRNDRTLDSVGDSDIYKFTTTATGQTDDKVRIDFADSDGDLILTLYDSSESVLGTSNLAGGWEEVSLDGRPAGTYYFGVDGYSSDVSGNYDIRIVAPGEPSLHILNFEPTATGFWVEFNRAVDASVLNLYDGSSGSLGEADVRLENASGARIPGSLVVSEDGRRITFVRTGGTLVPDTYTLTLRSADNGFRDGAGELLDGDGDGTPGGNYVPVFTVEASPGGEVTISIPDFARGYGQAVDVPMTDDVGIPVMLSTGRDVSSVDFDLRYDPTLLEITGATTSVPGALFAWNEISPGVVRFSLSSASEFSSSDGPIEIVRIEANVPDMAPYGSKQVLDLANVLVYDNDPGIPRPRSSRDDDGVHVACFVGDNSGDRAYTGGDVTLLQRVIVGMASGFPSYPLVHPSIIADLNWDGRVTGGDTTLLQRVVVGIPVPTVPPLPTVVPAPADGPDPRVFIPVDLEGHVGDTVTAPVSLTVTEAAGITISSVDLVVGYDAANFDVDNFRIGSLLEGADFSSPMVNTGTPGIIRVTMSTGSSTALLPLGTTGSLLEFDFTVKSGAPAGPSAINLRADFSDGTTTTITNLTDENVDELVLVPAPTNADTDAVDGVFTVVSDCQVVTSDPVNQFLAPGGPVSIDVNYTTDPLDATLTGLGLRLHYDSSVLTFDNLTNVLSTGFIQQQPPADDTADYDQDAVTDKYVLVTWADMTGNWPNEDSVRLLTSNFTSATTASEPTHVNFSASSTAAGWTFISTPSIVTFDDTPPTVTLTVPAYTNDTTPSVTVTATDAESGVPDGTAVTLDVDLNSDGDFDDAEEADYAVSTLTGGSSTFEVTPALGEGTYRLRARVNDQAGNPGASNIATMVVDTTSPAVTIGLPSVPITAGGPVSYVVTYSDSNFGEITLSDSDVSLIATGTAAGTVSVSGTGLTRTVTISNIGGDGTLGISLATGTASDVAGNLALTAGPSQPFGIDNTAPTVTISPPSDAVTATGPVSYLVTYVDSNFNASTLTEFDITLNMTGTANGTVSVSGTGLTRTVTISNINGDGTLGISLAEHTAADLAGNLAPAAGPSETFIVDSTLARQSVYGSPDIRNIVPGQTFNFNVQYTTSDNDDTLTGLGLRVHYDSSLLTFNEVSYVLPTGFIQQQIPVNDTPDYDQDPATDKYILVSWADEAGNWPGADLPVTLLTPSFNLAADAPADTITTINFSASSTAASHQFYSTPVSVMSVPVNLDVDGDGSLSEADANLILKYMFGFRDPSIISPALLELADRAAGMSPNPLNPDGSTGPGTIEDALSDGILICRYIAGESWKGPNLVDGVIYAGDPSPSPSWQDIWDILDSFNPATPVPVEGVAQLAAGLNANTHLASSGHALLAAPAAQDTVSPESAPEAQPASTAEGVVSSPFAVGMALTTNANEQVGLPALAAETSTANQQIVTPDPEDQTVYQGGPVTIGVTYTTNPTNAELTGLGLRMHYNSDLLTFEQLTGLLDMGLLQQQLPVDDTADYDSDPATDKYVLVSWADIDSTWPGQVPVSLLTANLKASYTASGATSVNFTSGSTAADWSFVGTSAGITFLPAHASLSGYVYVDANQNGQFDPNEGLPGVTIVLDGPVQMTVVTDDDGRYAFTDLPAGLYSITEQHPAACVDGPDQAGTIDGAVVGTAHNPGDLIDDIDLPGDAVGVDYRITETSLRPECIPNRVLATSTQPVGSERWREMIRSALAYTPQVVTAAASTDTRDLAAFQTIDTTRHFVTATTPIDHQPASEVTARSEQVPADALFAAIRSPAPLSADQLKPVIDAAIADWAEVGLPAETLNAMSTAVVSVADLPDSRLGWTEDGQVTLDLDAAGNGWFVDPTPGVDEEFMPTSDDQQLVATAAEAVGRMDLLTVVAHELGHVAGFDDLPAETGNVMSGNLSTGTRRVATVPVAHSAPLADSTPAALVATGPSPAENLTVSQGARNRVVERESLVRQIDSAENSIYLLDAVHATPLSPAVQTAFTVRETASRWGNALILFDYKSPDNFKFAGSFFGVNRLAIGRMTPRGYVLDDVIPCSLDTDRPHQLSLSIDGANVTLTVDGNQSLDHDLAATLGGGRLGLLSWKDTAVFEDISVQESD